MEIMMKHVAILLLLILVSACVSSAPRDNAPFGAIKDIGQLEGTYMNKGDGGPNEYTSLYLSRIIWPNEESIDHESIEVIQVTRQTEDTLRVHGLQGNAIVKTAEFTNGVNFKIKNGAIVLSSEAGIVGFKSGEPMVGFCAGGSKIGLDEKGHGKFHSGGAAVGLAYMFLPIAIGGSQDVRFYRIK